MITDVSNYVRASGGCIRWSDNRCHGPAMKVELPVDFCDYARAMIPKMYKANRPRYAPHITVVRRETTLIDTASPEWVKWDGMHIDFLYDPVVTMNDTYAWHAVDCERLLVLRRTLGLPETTEFTRSPDGQSPFHITVANFKRT